ncbi:hypothetical protein BJ912DRAFT_924446 [Pholiota molesta]|nr:hypothetical protein BJ912DRAFT_924446 [Pholiota molesta]
MNTSVNQILFPGDTVLAYLALAGATCLIYDHLTTLDIEWDFRTDRDGKFLKLYLSYVYVSHSTDDQNRYVGLALQIGSYSYIASFFIKNLLGESTERYDCATFNLISGFLTAVIFFAMHGIMVFRISSMYTHDRKILRILIAAYVIEFLSVIFIQLVQKMYGANVNDIETFIQVSVAFCAKEKNTPWIFVVWIPLILFEFLIFGLALALGIQYYRVVGNRWMFSEYRNSKRKTTPLLYILLRDSITFPCIFSFSCIVNLIICLLAAHGLRQVIAHIASLFPSVLSVILGSRLILNLREAYYESYDSEFSIHIDTSILLESNGGSIPFPTLIPLSNLRTPPTIDSL